MVRKTKAEAEHTRQQILDAARRVFHTHGVSRSSLEEIAQVAGVTRGAVYWHFQNKEDLFFAVREQTTLPLIDRVDAALADETLADPLEGIRLALESFLALLREDRAAREVFEIMRFRCEYVAEFAAVLQTMLSSQDKYRARLEAAYRRAADKGLLRAGLDPALLAKDTQVFTCGLIDRCLAVPGGEVERAAPALIAAHIAMRRA